MKKMKAQVLTATRELIFREVEAPSRGEDEVLVRVTHSGVCGTDLKIYRGDIAVEHPLILGHEMIGTVVEGSTDEVAPGDRVIVDPVTYCGTCFHCQVGQQHLCPKGHLLGRDRNGGFAQYVVAPGTNVYPLPAGIDDTVAPLIQVLTTCLHAQRLVEIFPGEAVVVLGLGVTGQLHVQLARARGAHPVIGVTRSEWKLDLAEELGADITIPAGEDVKAGILEATDGRGADLVIESVGKVATLAQAVDLARIGGRLMIFGIISETDGTLPSQMGYQLYYKELQIVHPRAAKGEDYIGSIDLVQREAVQLAPLVTHTLPLGELDRGLELLTSKGTHRMKVILEHTS